MAAAMDVDNTDDYGEGPSISSDKGSKKRFEVKKVVVINHRCICTTFF